MTVSFTTEGLDDVIKLLHEMIGVEQVIDATLKSTVQRIRQRVQANTPVGIRDNPGTLKRGWSAVKKSGKGWGFSNPVRHASVVEEGKYRGVGPRTVKTSKGIFSKQAPEGMLSPLISNENDINEMAESIANAIMRKLENA